MNSSNLPFQMHLEHDHNGRIIRKIEMVQGREPRDLKYVYDEEGQLIEVYDETETWGPVERYEYDAQGHRTSSICINQEPVRQELIYTTHLPVTRLEAIDNRMVYHDENGFRQTWARAEGEEQYTYAPDYRLLRVSRKKSSTGQEMVIEFDHDQNGQRYLKFVNGQSVEAYDWYDLIRLDAAATYEQDLSFHYNKGERVPYAATFNGEQVLYLYYDQIGSLRVVADEYGRVVKEVRYSAFGVIEEDTNPALYMPIGFAGGLHDRDVGFVRFGYRDYDPRTSRFTAKDPLGYAAGEDDLYGYCFDDPVNGIDPLGLWTDVHFYEGDMVDHVGIDPGGQGAVGRYPKNDKDIAGGEGDIRDETRTPAKTVRIPTSPEQEANIRERINLGKKGTSVRYQLGLHDCVDYVDDELEAEGILTPPSWGVRSPKKYIDRLEILHK